MDDQKTEQVGRARDKPEDGVGASLCQDLADDEREEHAADSAGHATDADDRAHGLAGEHVGGEGEDISRPALVRGRSQRDEEHRRPHADVVNEDDRDDADGTNAHRGLAGRIDRPSGPDQATREPAAPDAAHVGDEVDCDERESDILEVDAMLLVQEARNPEEVEPPHWVRHELSDGEGPGLTELQEAQPTDLTLRVGWVGLDVGQLGLSNRRMLAGRVVGDCPPDNPDEANSTRDDEGPFPAPGNSDPRHEEWGAESTDVGTGVKDAGRQGALLLGEPFGGGLDRGWEITGLSETEQEPHQSKAGSGPREGHPGKARLGVDLHPRKTEGWEEVSETMPHGSQAPEADKDNEALLDANAIDNATREQHADGVGKLEAEDDGRIGPLIPAEFLFQSWLKQANDLTVNIVDRGGEEQQRANNPALVAYFS